MADQLRPRWRRLAALMDESEPDVPVIDDWWPERIMNAMLLRPAPGPEALPLPLLGRLVPAGFPSPADDYLEGEIDLNRLLIERPAACYLMRVSGSSMSGAGILDGDLVVVDRSVEAVPGHVVVAVIHGEMTIKRLR